MNLSINQNQTPTTQLNQQILSIWPQIIKQGIQTKIWEKKQLWHRVLKYHSETKLTNWKIIGQLL